MGFEDMQIVKHGFTSPEYHYGEIWGKKARFAAREDAVNYARGVYDEKVKNNSSLQFPPFEDCLRDTEPMAPHLNPNFGGVYLFMKPV